MAKKRFRTKSPEDSMESVISNSDLVFEIFRRLPAKSLIRFKLLSKSWLSIISDPQFCIAHSRENSFEYPVSDFYYNDRSRNVSISLDHRSRFPSLTTCLDPVQQNVNTFNIPEIVHSCKGLTLLVGRYGWRVIVLNPTTQKYRLITEPLGNHRLEMRFHYCEFLLAFEPVKSHHYKVVVLCDKRTNNTTCVHIFSSQSESWKEISLNVSPAVERRTKRVYWNGAIHWLNEKNMHFQFDVDAEKLIITQLPPKPEIFKYWNDKYFGESNGRLFLIQCWECALGFRMLEMNKDTLCWDIKHRINLTHLVSQLGKEHPKYSVLYVKSALGMKSCSVIIAICGKVVVYEVKKGKSHTNTIVCDLPDAYLGLKKGCFHPYIQSLAPV